MKARERFGASFAVDVTPKWATGYKGRSPVATNLSRHDQITDREELGDSRKDFRRELVYRSQDVSKCFEFREEPGEVPLHSLYL